MPEAESQEVNNFGALTSPPPPGTYRHVVRRIDRQPLPFRIVLDYNKPAFIARAIEFKGRICPTLFLQTKDQLRQAKGRGYRYDITGDWMAHLRNLAKAPAPSIPEGELMDMLKPELVELADALGVSNAGNKAGIVARIEPLRE